MPLETGPDHRPGTVPSNEAADPPPGRGGGLPHVLVAEDEPHIARMLETLLDDAGIRVTLVRDGETALETIRSDETISLAILDLMMPGLSGLEVLRETRRTAASLPVIVLTAKGESEVRDQALELGATEVVTKPFSPRKLVHRVKELCAA